MQPHKNEVKIYSRGLPRIFIEPVAIRQMARLVGKCKEEVLWIGPVRTDGRTYILGPVLVPPQEVSSASCEIEADEYGEWMAKVLEEKGEDFVNSMRFTGHSHHTMGTSPSSTDDEAVRVWGASFDWFIRGIANKTGRLELSFYDFKNGFEYRDLAWDYALPGVEGVEEEIDLLIKENVRDRVPNWKKQPDYGHRGGNGGHNLYNKGGHVQIPASSEGKALVHVPRSGWEMAKELREMGEGETADFDWLYVKSLADREIGKLGRKLKQIQNFEKLAALAVHDGEVRNWIETIM